MTVYKVELLDNLRNSVNLLNLPVVISVIMNFLRIVLSSPTCLSIIRRNMLRLQVVDDSINIPITKRTFHFFLSSIK
jgi:hypothetical protein